MTEKKRLVPKRRFKGFDGDWKECKVGDVYFFKNGLNKEKEFFGRGTAIVNFTDVFHNRGIYFNNLTGKVTLSREEINRYNVKKGDVFFTRTSEVIKEIGYPSVMMDEPDLTVFSGFVLRGRAIDKDLLVNEFKKYVFYTNSFRQEMMTKSSMTTRALTSGTALKQMYFKFPENKEEQAKIGHFFKTLDDTIALHQRKLEKQKALKEAYLSEMFPSEGEKVPKRRFKGFTGDWIECQLGNLVDKAVDNRGKTPPISNSKKYPLLEVASLGNLAPDYSKVTKYVSENIFLNWFRAHIKKNDILFSTVGNTGIISLMDDNKRATIAQNIVAFRAISNNNPIFIAILLQLPKNVGKIKSIEMGAIQPSVKVSQLIHLEYLVPGVKEQQKIGQFFKSLDDAITIQQNKIEKLQRIKKAYLSELFV